MCVLGSQFYRFCYWLDGVCFNTDVITVSEGEKVELLLTTTRKLSRSLYITFQYGSVDGYPHTASSSGKFNVVVMHKLVYCSSLCDWLNCSGLEQLAKNFPYFCGWGDLTKSTIMKITHNVCMLCYSWSLHRKWYHKTKEWSICSYKTLAGNS